MCRWSHKSDRKPLPPLNPPLMGEVVSLDISSMVTVFRDDGKRIRIHCVNIDVTEFKQSEVKLKPAASVFIHIREGITITDPADNIIDVNDAFTAIL